MLRDMVDNLGLSTKLSDIRLVAAALLAFSAFLRFDELSKLRCCNLSFADAVLSVHVSSSKTDQFRQGDTVVIARTGNISCPVAMLEKYIASAESLCHRTSSYLEVWWFQTTSRTVRTLHITFGTLFTFTCDMVSTRYYPVCVLFSKVRDHCSHDLYHVLGFNLVVMQHIQHYNL